MLVFYTPIFGVLMKMFMGGQIFGAGVIIVSFFLLILCGMVCGTDSDIFCLKSVKRTLDDPYNYLQSWNFNNNTEGYICKFTGVECWHPDENKVLNLKLSNNHKPNSKGNNFSPLSEQNSQSTPKTTEHT